MPTKEGRKTFDADTRWRVHWSYRYKRAPGACDIGSTTVDVKVAFTFPLWYPHPGVPQKLRDDWKRYMIALQRHEDGHKDIGVRAGHEVIEALRALPSRASCRAMGEAANAAGHRAVQRHIGQDQAYDRATDHGVTQGVQLGP